MNTETLIRAIGKIDEETVIKAGAYQVSRRNKSLRLLYGSLAACLLLLAVLAVIQLNGLIRRSQPDINVPVVTHTPGTPSEPTITLRPQDSEPPTSLLSYISRHETGLRVLALILTLAAGGAAAFFLHRIRKRKSASVFTNDLFPCTIYEEIIPVRCDPEETGQDKGERS